MGHRIPHGALLEFVFSQSYLKSFGDMSSAAPEVQVPGLTDTAAIELEWQAAGAVHGLPYPVSEASLPAADERGRALASVLHGGAGILRYEPSNSYNPHRGYPSARARFAIHTYVLTRRGAWYYDALGHSLRAVGARAEYDPAAPDTALVLAGCFAAFPAAYGPLRYALLVLEAGHALRHLTLVASALGFSPTVELAFPDHALLHALALPRDGSWSPVAILSLDSATDRSSESCPWFMDAIPGADLERASPDRVSTIERATWLDADGARSWQQCIDNPGSRVQRRVVAGPESLPEAPTMSERSLGDIIYARNAGRAAAGLCGDASSIPAGILHAAVHALRPSLPTPDRDLSSGALAGTLGGILCGLRLLFAAERVTGLASGIYELHPATQTLSVIRPGPCLHAVQAGFTYAPSVTNIRSMNLVWFLVVDVPAVLERWGPRGLRLANLEMGWVAQSLCTAAAAVDLFARPVRSYREDVLDPLLGLGPTEMVGYEILCARNRFSDFLFDLRPPAPDTI